MEQLNNGFRRLLTIKEVSERFGVPKSWLYARSRHNALPGMVRLGKYVRFNADIIEEYIENGGDSCQKQEMVSED